jgi:hypothetical protein
LHHDLINYDALVRTTVTLDPDVEALVKRAMRERGLTFKQAVNDAIRAGMASGPRVPQPRFSTHDMGAPLIDVTKALRLAGELEDQELAARLARGA